MVAVPTTVTDNKWYMAALFAIVSDISATGGRFSIGFVDPTITQQLASIGVDVGIDATNFVLTDSVASAVSTYAVVQNEPIVGEMWCDGAGHVYARFGGGAVITITSSRVYAGSPWIVAEGGETAIVGSMGHLCLVTAQS